MIDLMAALIAYLESESDVTDLVSTRIYGEEVPRSAISSMPQKSVVLSHSGSPGGPGSADFVDLAHWRYDFMCYGEIPYEAGLVANAVYSSLKDLDREVFSSVLLHRAIHSGGPSTGRDRDTDWPFAFLSFDVLAAELAA